MAASADILLDDIYRRGVVATEDGTELPLNSEISRQEGAFLRSLISADESVIRTLEVGCAYGLSSVNICAALQDRDGSHHTIVDPFQRTWWKSVGLTNLGRAGLSRFTLVEEKSEFALPSILSTTEATFDLIFLDGWHTFDHTMLDCFYSSRLLKIGGYLVLDDAHWQSVTKVLRCLETYPCFERVGSVPLPEAHFSSAVRTARRLFSNQPLQSVIRHTHPKIRAALGPRATMVALRKISADERSFDWFADF